MPSLGTTRPQGELQRLGSAAGQLLGCLSRAAAVARSNRPLHPRGVTTSAVATIRGGTTTGVPWLDSAGRMRVTVRMSRATGLPVAWPDITGVAIRIPGAALGRQAPADLLFASTGDSALGRFVLAPRFREGTGPLTTLLPYRSVRGPLLMRLTPAPRVSRGHELPTSYVLSFAIGRGSWQPVGDLELGAPLPEPADEVRHDPVLNVLPGLQQYGWVTRLREPAYRAARTVRAR